MQEQENTSVVTLENQLTERFGLLLSQTQLAELLESFHGRSALQSELPLRPADPITQGLRPEDRPTCVLPGHGGCPDHHRFR